MLYIQRESFGGPFVMANVGGRVGVVNQDRTVGLRAHLHRTPANLTRITTHVSASTGLRRNGKTEVTLKNWLPEIALDSVYGSLLSTLQKEGGGTARFGYNIHGHRANGKPFTLRRRDVVADSYDITYAAGFPAAQVLDQLVFNGFQKVRINSVETAVHAMDRFHEWTIRKAQLRQGGQWVALKGHHSVRHGTTLHLRAKLVRTGQLAPRRWVPITVKVPAGARGTGSLGLVGGEQFGFRSGGRAHSFDALLTQLRHQPHNASVVAAINLYGGKLRGSGATHMNSVRVDRATSGSVFGQIRVR